MEHEQVNEEQSELARIEQINREMREAEKMRVAMQAISGQIRNGMTQVQIEEMARAWIARVGE